MKSCTKCQQEKPLNEYRNDKYTRDGKTTRCKECLSTYKPKEIRCYHCRGWFTKRRGWHIFCKKSCRDMYWSKINFLSTRGHMNRIDYQRRYSKKDKNKCVDCEKIISNTSKRCTRCHCLIMSRKAGSLRTLRACYKNGVYKNFL